MGYEEFKQELKERVQQIVGEQIEVYFCTVEKNNQYLKEAMSFREEGVNTMPMIHLQDLYEEYQQEEDMDNIVEFVLEVLETKAVVDERAILGEWENVRKRIGMKLINYEWNQEMLEHTPHIRMLDLAVVFQIELYQHGGRKATVMIKNELLKIWGINLSTLLEAAMENLNQEPYEILRMKDVICGILKMKMDEDSEDEDDDFMYVMSNEERCNGAAGILRGDLLKEFADRIQDNFYILPSSTHEIIFLPEAHADEKEKMDAMVKEINETQVAVEERLSDHVYYYDRAKEVIMC